MSFQGSGQNKIPPGRALNQMIIGYRVSQAIYVAAKLSLADHLTEGPRNVDELAKSVDAHPDALYRLLRALASLGLFTEIEPRRFALTEMGTYLRTGFPGSLRALALQTNELYWESWGNFLHSVKTGETAFRHVHGTGIFDYLRRDPPKAKTFDEAMTGFVTMNGASVASVYDFKQFRKVIDVGGGHGALMACILKASPETRGVIYDLPHVVEGAKKKMTAAGLLERCEVLAGDFFDSVPTGGEAYILSSIIHDWDDEHSILILKNCQQAMSRQAKLLLVEMIIPPGNTPFLGKLQDLHMLANYGGRERTEEEYHQLLSAAGFRLVRIIPTPTASSLIEAMVL